MVSRVGTSLGGITLSLTLYFLASAAATAQPLNQLVEGCAGCHGEKGASPHEKIPIIGGLSAFYIEEQLNAYRKARPCETVEYPEGPKKGESTDMCQVAKELTEDQIAELAEYYDQQPFVPADQEHDAALASKGAQIHQRNCEKCHSEGGSLAFDDAGILAGQWKPYLELSFKEYRAGERWMPEKMEPKIKALSDDDVQALLEYYASGGS